MNDRPRGRGGPCGGSEVCGIHVGANCIRPTRHPAGMNDCPRGWGTHCEKAVQVLHGRFAHCEGVVQVLRGHFAHCDDAVQVVHGRFTHCDDAVQVLHSRFTHCDGAVQVLHGRFAHCDGPRNGAYAFAPLPGYTPFMYPANLAGIPDAPGQTSLPPQGPSVDAPAKFAGVRRRPGKLDRRP